MHDSPTSVCSSVRSSAAAAGFASRLIVHANTTLLHAPCYYPHDQTSNSNAVSARTTEMPSFLLHRDSGTTCVIPNSPCCSFADCWRRTCCAEDRGAAFRATYKSSFTLHYNGAGWCSSMSEKINFQFPP